MVKINAKDIPKGWHTIVHTRTSGKTAGKTDNHYFTPDWKHRFRVEVRAFLEKKKQDAAPAESADFMVEIDTDGNEVIVIDSSDEEDNDSLFL